MAKKDIGMTSEGMFDEMYPVGKNVKNYPTIDLPVSFIDGKDVKVGGKVEVSLIGTVESIHKKRVVVKFSEGEIESENADKKGEVGASKKVV